MENDSLIAGGALTLSLMVGITVHRVCDVASLLYGNARARPWMTSFGWLLVSVGVAACMGAVLVGGNEAHQFDKRAGTAVLFLLLWIIPLTGAMVLRLVRLLNRNVGTDGHGIMTGMRRIETL